VLFLDKISTVLEMESTEFMMNLEKELTTVRKVAETTARGYIKSLYALNKKKPFKNINFLKKTDDIDSVIAEYAESTQRGLLATITSVLSLYKDKAGYKKLYQSYHDKMMERVEDKREEKKEGGIKSKKQTENWIPWEEIQSRKNGLKGGLISDKKRSVNTDEYDKLLQYVVLSLYTEVAPRRNQDYLDMFVVKKWNESMPKDKNYLDVAGKQFVYEKYKTSKKYGTQKEEIPPALWETLQMFLKHHPLWKEGKRKVDPVKLLVNADGTPITAVNAITRLLNKVFDKKVGSSMLRHIFLTDKYKDTLEEMKRDSTAMGHSTSQQRDYVLANQTIVPPTPSQSEPVE